MSVSIFEETAKVLANERVDTKLYIMSLEAPLIAESVAPGQFVHAKLPGMEGHILRRPFSLYTASAARGIVEILYQVVGFGSDHMTTLKDGSEINLLGPLGTSWNPPAGTKSALLVAGGVGAAPLYLLADQLISSGVCLEVIMGAQTKSALVCHGRYRALFLDRESHNSKVHCATDDGSFGHAGFCTTLVEEAVQSKSYDYAAVCGPEVMMKIVSQTIREASIPCEVSFEKRMACGIGACLSCVVETTEGIKRACADGPVFDAGKVVFS